MHRIGSPPVAHAASMIRMDVAKRYRYNSRLRRSEDADFLQKVLLENQFCILHDVLYTYREYRSTSREDVLAAYWYRMMMFWGFRQQYPVDSLWLANRKPV